MGFFLISAESPHKQKSSFDQSLIINLWENDPELILDVAIQSFKQLIRKLKFNRHIKNPFGYFYGILENKFFIIYDKALKEKYDLNDVEMMFSLGLNP